MNKTKVYLYSDNAEITDLICFDLSTIFEMIDADTENHQEGEDYQYTITVAWMTEREIQNLPEAEF